MTATDLVLTPDTPHAPANLAIDDAPARSFVRPIFLFPVLAVPALWTLALILQYGVNSSWGDDWDGFVPILQKWHGGTLTFHDLFVPHNEHRIFFPRLIALALGTITRGDTRFSLLVIWLLACVCSISVWRILQTTELRHSRFRFWLLLAANLLIFSHTQWGNFLWDFQIPFLLPPACWLTSFWLARTARSPWNFLLTALSCFIATFSLASGFIGWLLTAPLLFQVSVTPKQRRAFVAWCVAGVMSIICYLIGYQTSSRHASWHELLQHPFRVLQFVLTYFGSLFIYGTDYQVLAVAATAGAVMLCLFFACLSYLWKNRSDRSLLADAIPWLSVAGIAFLNAGLTTIGRFNWGIIGAAQSRYITFAIALPISLLFLIPQILGRHPQRNRRVGFALGVMLLPFLLLFASGESRSLRFWRTIQHTLLSGKAAIFFSGVVDAKPQLAQHVHDFNIDLLAEISGLDQLGHLQPPRLRSPAIGPLVKRSSAPESNGALRGCYRKPDDSYLLNGSALLPLKDRAADSVLISYETAGSEEAIFRVVSVGYLTREASNPRSDNAYLRSAWQASWKASELPTETTLVRAWAFDAEEPAAYLIGTATLR